MENNIEILKELLETGVITQEEYDAKIQQLTSLEEKTGVTDRPLQGTIDYDELKKLEDLKREGIVDQVEFSKIATQLCGITLDQDNYEKPSTERSIGGWLKRNVIALIAIVALLGALGVMGSKLNAIQTENATLKSNLESAKHNESYNYNQYLKAKKSEDAVKDFYLDYAVITSEHDNYYHRYMCSRLNSVDSIWIYNPEAAKDKGFTKCPTCFGVDKNTYIDQRF